MAQPAKETQEEIEMVQEEKENDDWNTSFLPVLNLLIVFLSSISLSEEERLNHVDIEWKSAEDNEAEACISGLESKRRKINGVKFMRRTPRMQATVRDSRYNFMSFTKIIQIQPSVTEKSCIFLQVNIKIFYNVFLLPGMAEECNRKCLPRIKSRSQRERERERERCYSIFYIFLINRLIILLFISCSHN
jgi:hypothetical protein